MASVIETHFAPGTDFRIRAEWRRPAQPVHARVRVRTPGRLHFNVWDFTKMQPVLPGAGGVGISTSTGFTEVEVTRGAAASGPAADFPTARHLLALFKALVGYEGDDVHVSVPARIRHVHSGYGSNVTFNTALVAGLNALFGTPFSVPEMWDILTQNFVENANDGERVYWGLDTGVGEACVLYGGLVWVDADARYTGSATAHLWVVTAAGDPAALGVKRLQELGQVPTHGLGDVEEQEVLYRECMEYQAEYGERLAHFLEHRLKPHLLRDDAHGLLEACWDMNTIGNHRILERFWGKKVMGDISDTARRAGALFATMSSAGPSLFALTDTEEQAVRVRDALQAVLSDTHSHFQIGRAGEKLRIEVG